MSRPESRWSHNTEGFTLPKVPPRSRTRPPETAGTADSRCTAAPLAYSLAVCKRLVFCPL